MSPHVQAHYRRLSVHVLIKVFDCRNGVKVWVQEMSLNVPLFKSYFSYSGLQVRNNWANVFFKPIRFSSQESC